jgi:hypothetical protein
MDETEQSALEVIQENARNTATYTGALLVLMPAVPITATIISIVTFVGPNPKAPSTITGPAWLESVIPVLVGTLSVLILWFLLAFFFRRFTAVHRANEKSYYSLLNHLSTLNYYLDTLPDDAKKEVLNYRNAICTGLKQRSTAWVIGNGYIELWDLMDSAEEALITIAPLEKVVSDAVYDEMRLNDSKIENSEEWANKLRSAVKALDNNAVDYLKPAVGIQSSRVGAVALQQTPQEAQTQSPATSEGAAVALQQAEARAILRKVRETINSFNIKSWDALISARNQLLATMVLVGLTTYVFVELAILFRVTTLHIVVATIFAFVGALAGLIGRLYTESQSDRTIDDYRLSMARLLVTPLLSALAAVIGVMVVAKTTTLDDIYTFKASTFVANLIIAATFGLTPNLLINQLQKKSDGYKANLQSTQATSGK